MEDGAEFRPDDLLFFCRRLDFIADIIDFGSRPRGGVLFIRRSGAPVRAK